MRTSLLFFQSPFWLDLFNHYLLGALKTNATYRRSTRSFPQIYIPDASRCKVYEEDSLLMWKSKATPVKGNINIPRDVLHFRVRV